MRITLSEIFAVEVVDDAVHIRPTRAVELSPFWEIRLEAEMERTPDAEHLLRRDLEVDEDTEGLLHVYGFAPAEAR